MIFKVKNSSIAENVYLARDSQKLPWDDEKGDCEIRHGSSREYDYDNYPGDVTCGVRHGVGEHWLFTDILRKNGYNEDLQFQFRYQQYISNFIRTGNPNSKSH